MDTLKENKKEQKSRNVPECPADEQVKTPIEKLEERLKPKQLRAIELMVNEGFNNKQVAAQLDLHRKTVSRWKNHHKPFIQALQYR